MHFLSSDGSSIFPSFNWNLSGILAEIFEELIIYNINLMNAFVMRLRKSFVFKARYQSTYKTFGRLIWSLSTTLLYEHISKMQSSDSSCDNWNPRNYKNPIKWSQS
jgi:hypothetical protein